MTHCNINTITVDLDQFTHFNLHYVIKLLSVRNAHVDWSLACHFSISQLPCTWDYSVFQACSLWFFHLSLLILCLCGLVSPPLLPFIIRLLCPLLCFSCSTFTALSPLFLPLASSMSLSHSSPSLPPPCSVRDKFVEVDLKPVCKHCYERLPDDMKRRLAKRERDSKEKKKKLLIPMCLWSSFSPFSSLLLFFHWSVSTFLPFYSILFLCHCRHISNMLRASFIPHINFILSSSFFKAKWQKQTFGICTGWTYFSDLTLVLVHEDFSGRNTSQG